MKKFTFPILFVISMLFGACGDERSPIVKENQAVDTTGNAAPNISSFRSDPSFIVTNEIVSQYGPSSIIRDVVIDNNGTIWMATWDGIVSYDPETKQFTNHTLKSGLSHHRVYSVLLDSKGNLWFGTLGAGVYKYDGARFTNWSSHKGLLNDVVMDIAEDAKGNIWFATNEGVSRFNGTSFMNMDSTNGINGAVYALAEDQKGVMWIGGENGLFQASQATLSGNAKVRELISSYNTSYTNVRDLHWSGTSMCVGCSSGFYCSVIGDVNQLLRINGEFTSYIHPSISSDLIITSDGIRIYTTPNYKANESPALPFAKITDEKNNLGIFGATQAKDGTIWYGAMDGLHSVKDGEVHTYRKQ
jgi:ligand-binding sensor domain-containing protein